MRGRSVILYWLLLLIPAVIISAVVFQLLRHEQERIEQMTVTSARDRARTVAETLQITIGEVEDELLDTLLQLPEYRLEETLVQWAGTNPLIRNVFIWNPRSGLVYPRSDLSATSEERRFAARYDALFTGRVPWSPAKPESPSAASLSQPQEIREIVTARKSLVSMARSRDSLSEGETRPEADASPRTGGWIPWFEENRLYILGWVQPNSGGLIHGLELELMTLLSRLVTGFPASVPEGAVYALLDGTGLILHQVGEAELSPDARPDLSMSLAPYLPHWQVAVFFTDPGGSAMAGRGFVILTGLLLAIFLAAIILGGALLTWQAHRNMIDARQKTSFVSNVSHELKTPLTSIRMYAELLSGNRIKEPEKRKKYIQVIVDESQRLTRLVNNVLDFSRLEQGRKQYHLERFDLAAFITDIIEANRLRVQEAGLILNTQIPDESVTVRTDRDSIEQALLNLLDNALKYALDGGELRVELEKIDDHACELRVMDRGPGVPAAHQAKIFEKFHRVDETLTTRQPGSGLGLSIARRLMKDMGGDVIYRPRPEGGSVFTIRIPVDPSKGDTISEEA